MGCRPRCIAWHAAASDSCRVPLELGAPAWARIIAASQAAAMSCNNMYYQLSVTNNTTNVNETSTACFPRFWLSNIVQAKMVVWWSVYPEPTS